jgi:hypothetical protein
MAALVGFAPFVPSGGFFVVEDGCVDIEHMWIHPDWPRGVLPALHDWLRTPEGREFTIRRDLELYGVSCHPEGFLQRRPGPSMTSSHELDETSDMDMPSDVGKEPSIALMGNGSFATRTSNMVSWGVHVRRRSSGRYLPRRIASPRFAKSRRAQPRASGAAEGTIRPRGRVRVGTYGHCPTPRRRRAGAAVARPLSAAGDGGLHHRSHAPRRP